MEEWKQIIDYPNYSISNLGNVRNDKTGRILKSKLHNGYFAVDLGRCNTNMIHKLLGSYFLENPNPNLYVEVDHIDRVKTNNSLDNLRWCSKSQNQQNKNKPQNCISKYRGVTFDKQKHKWKSHKRYNGKSKHIGHFNTEEEAAKAYNQFILDNNLGDFCELNKF